MSRFFVVTIFCVVLSCSTNNPLREGTFILYENNQVVDTIYRLDRFQIESANGSGLVANLNWISNDSLVISGNELDPTGVDTIRFLNVYSRLSDSSFQVIGQPFHSKIEYRYEAVLKKISDSIMDEEYFHRLRMLNNFD